MFPGRFTQWVSLNWFLLLNPLVHTPVPVPRRSLRVQQLRHSNRPCLPTSNNGVYVFATPLTTVSTTLLQWEGGQDRGNQENGRFNERHDNNKSLSFYGLTTIFTLDKSKRENRRARIEERESTKRQNRRERIQGQSKARAPRNTTWVGLIEAGSN